MKKIKIYLCVLYGMNCLCQDAISVSTDQTVQTWCRNHLCQGVNQVTAVQTAQSYVLTLPMVTDVKDSVTVTITAVMCLQDVGLRPQVIHPLTINIFKRKEWIVNLKYKCNTKICLIFYVNINLILVIPDDVSSVSPIESTASRNYSIIYKTYTNTCIFYNFLQTFLLVILLSLVIYHKKI